MPIRTKTVNQPYITCPPGQGGGSNCVSHDNYVDVPIQDWNSSPATLNKSWTTGTAVPSQLFADIRFPELSEIYTNPNFKIKVRKIVSGVDFVALSGANFTGNAFNSFSLEAQRLLVNFQNMDNLSPGYHEIVILFEAYGVNGSNEVFLEDSTIQNMSLTVSVNVTSGSNFNTDKSSYNIVYNKADNSLSGDSRIVVFSSSAVTATVTDLFIQFTQSSGSNEQYLTFQNNSVIQGKAVGNYSGNVNITQGNVSKSVSVNLQVINDTTQFYLDQSTVNITLQKNLSETKSFAVGINNPNNLNLAVSLKPSFIVTANIINGQLVCETDNSANLPIGNNYSGEIHVTAGALTKKVTVYLAVIQGVTHDFSGAAYFFAKDPNKITLNKTNSASTYVKMVLSMFYRGFGSEFLEEQTYTFPFFKGSTEIYPGDEIQDFFIKAKDFNTASDPVYEYDLTRVNMTFYEMNAQDEIVYTFGLNNIYFAPGKKPKCFPIFTDHNVRRTFPESVIKLSVDRLTEKVDIQALYDNYLPSKPNFVAKFAVEQLSFSRNQFKPELKNDVIGANSLVFIPIPGPEIVSHIFWETQNLVFDWFTATGRTKISTEIENVIGESKMHREEKFDSLYSKNLIINSGWILKEEIELIDDILLSRLCFIYIDGVKYTCMPVGKKNELKDTENNKFSMDLEFKILIRK